MEQVVEIDVPYTKVDVYSTLESISTTLKTNSCKVSSQLHPQSIYRYLETSNTIYERLSVCSKCSSKVVDKRSYLDIKRHFIQNKYYTVDTAFPLFRGLYCLRDSFSGSTCVKQVSQHELSLYKETIKVLYYLNGVISKYSQEEIEKLYSPFEFHILLPELIASLVQGLITTREEEILLELLNRDSNIATFLDKVSSMCSFEGIGDMKNSIEIVPILPDFSPIIIWNPTIMAVLKEYISMGLSLILTQIIKKSKTLTSKINMRAISDFRLIFEVDKSVDHCVFNIVLTGQSLGDVTFTLISEDSTEIVNKYFLHGGAK